MNSYTIEYQRFGDPVGMIRLSDRYIRTLGPTAPAEEVSVGISQENLDRGMAALSDFGFSKAMLWVHPGNERARRFYEAHGWVDDGVERQQTVIDVEVPEVRYSLDLADT